MACNMQKSFHEIEITTTVHLVGFNHNRCITMYGINNVKSSKLSTLTICIILYHMQASGAQNPGVRLSEELILYVAPGIYVSSIWNLPHVTLLVPWILRWLLDFCKTCAPLTHLFFFDMLTTVSLSYRKPATMGTFCCNSCGVQNNNKRYALYGLPHVTVWAGGDFQHSEMLDTWQTSY